MTNAELVSRLFHLQPLLCGQLEPEKMFRVVLFRGTATVFHKLRTIMYLTPVSLDPPLKPRDYCDEDFWKKERRAVFAESWHLVAVGSQLARNGQYVTTELLGVPIVVRNFNGELVALRNVCAHRQSIIATKPAGCSPTLKCPYHGWEYGNDGRTRKLPGASNFPKFDHDHFCLDKFQLEQCGDLVFIRLSEQGPTLREWIGERFETIENWFSLSTHHFAMHKRYDLPVNWKLPVENSLESYHIPCVHPQTFHTDPAEPNSTHIMHDTGTCFTALFHPPRIIDELLDRAERWVMWILGEKPNGVYHHHHIFPNLMISHTDTTSFVQMVHPIGPSRCSSVVWQFGLGDRRMSFFPRMVAYGWSKFTGSLTRTIVAEDVSIFELVQSGTEGSNRAGILGRCEERLYASQKYIREKVDAWSMRQSTAVEQTDPSPTPQAELQDSSQQNGSLT